MADAGKLSTFIEPLEPDGYFDADSPIIRARVQGDVQDRFILRADGTFGYGDGTIAIPAEIAGEMVPWEDAGGEIPSFSGLGEGAVAIDLGTAPIIHSSWGELAGWGGGHCRMHQDTVSEAGATGVWGIHGLPKAPAFVQTGPTEGGHRIGAGFLFNAATGYERVPVDAILDPAYSETDPVLFPAFVPTDISVVTDSDPSEVKTTLRYAKVPNFAPDGDAICIDDLPFDFIDGAIANITFWYQLA